MCSASIDSIMDEVDESHLLKRRAPKTKKTRWKNFLKMPIFMTRNTKDVVFDAHKWHDDRIAF